MTTNRALLLRSLAAALAVGFAVASCSADGDEQVGTGPPTTVPAEQSPRSNTADAAIFEEACADAPPETHCGVTEAELRDMNLHYADRMDFAGDPADAAPVVGVVRQRLAPYVGTAAQPSAEDVEAALDGLDSVQTSTNAVRTSGTAFAVAVDGGCVFGSIHDGELTVEIGGYINDGGCLASYGH